MLLNLLQYYWHKLRADPYLDFVDHGLGIGTRSKKAKTFWQPHLLASQQFQLECAFNLPKQAKSQLTILGAGRLLDVPSKEYSKIFKTIHLVDADPSCLRHWRNLQKCSSAHVTWEKQDISSRLEQWKASLAHFISSNPNISKSSLYSFLEELNMQTPSKFWVIPPSSVVVSLNLLSQLGVYWRDRVITLLRTYASKFLDKDQNLDAELESAVTRMVATLENEHLDLLSNSGAHAILLIFDDELYYYNRDKSDWQVEQALAISAPSDLSGYSSANQSSWLWHLVPQGLEHSDYGEIHRVQAKSFVAAGAMNI